MKFLHIACCSLLVLLPPACEAQTTTAMNQIVKNGMSVNWQIEGGHVRVVVTAPTSGWIAIGFNTTDELAGTNLIMGCVAEGKAVLSDRYIVAPGDHRSVKELGGAPVARLLSGSEEIASTRIEFLLPLRASDRWHHNLQAGNTYTLLLAFSREDDFAHHSMMRTSTAITL